MARGVEGCEEAAVEEVAKKWRRPTTHASCEALRTHACGGGCLRPEIGAVRAGHAQSEQVTLAGESVFPHHSFCTFPAKDDCFKY